MCCVLCVCRSGVREQSADVGRQTARLRSRFRAAGRRLRQERPARSHQYDILILLATFKTDAFQVSYVHIGTASHDLTLYDVSFSIVLSLQ